LYAAVFLLLLTFGFSTGCSEKRLLPPGVTVISVALAPDSVLLDTASTQQFTVVAHLSDSSTVNVTGALFTGTGGTINSAGVYTSGSVNGLFRVIATDSLGILADTSKVIIQAAGVTATKLAITTQPTTSTVGATLSPQPVVQLQDASSNPVAQSGVAVTAAIGSGSGTLAGTLTQSTAASGAATFTNLAINGTPGPFTLTFSATGLTGNTTTPITVAAGAASKLATTTQPTTATVGATLSPQPVVQLQDASNNPVAQGGVAVTVAIGSGTGTLAGTLTQNTAASGAATFTNLVINGTPGPFTLTFSATGLTGNTTTPITVAGGAASKLAITSQPTTATVGAALAPQPVVQLQDASNNPAAQSGVAVTVAIGSGTGTLAGTLTQNTGATGAATFTNLVINGTPGAFTLAFSAAGLTGATTAPITVAGTAASKLAITTQPTTAIVGAALAPQPVVQLQDASSNPAAQSGVAVTVAIGSGTGTLAGTLTQNTAASGAATFTNLVINGTAGPFTLAFSAAGLSGATTTPVTVAAGAASKLAITTQPTTATVGLALAPQLVVQLLDASNNPVAQSVVVTVAIGSGTGTLAGTLTQNTGASGAATFTNLVINGTAGPFTLTFTAAGLSNATTTPIAVAAGAASKLAITTQPTTATVGVAVAPQPVVQLRDASNNPVAGSVAVTVAIGSGTGTVAGTLTQVTAASGVATFTNLAINGTPGPFTLTFSAAGLTGATTTPVAVAAGAASKLAITTQPTTATVGVALAPQPVVQLRDASNNPVGGSVAVTVAIGSGTGTLAGTLTQNTAASGAATFTNLVINGTPGPFTLTFSAAGLTGATTTPITVAAAGSCGATGSGATLAAISRDGGSTAGGATVQLTGTGFQATDCVNFGTTPASGVTLVSATTLKAVVPPGTVGTVNVSVVQNGVTSTLGNAFTYYPSATVTYATQPDDGTFGTLHPTPGTFGPTISTDFALPGRTYSVKQAAVANDANNHAIAFVFQSANASPANLPNPAASDANGVYARWYTYMPQSTVTAMNTAQAAGSGQMKVHLARPASGHPWFEIGIGPEFNTGNGTGVEVESDFDTGVFYIHNTGVVLPANTWVEWQVSYRRDTVAHIGYAKLWLNGRLVGSSSHANYGDDALTDAVSMGLSFGMVYVQNVANSLTVYVGGIQLANGYIEPLP
jgi:adhesin/invasin